MYILKICYDVKFNVLLEMKSHQIWCFVGNGFSTSLLSTILRKMGVLIRTKILNNHLYNKKSRNEIYSDSEWRFIVILN